MRGEVWCRCLYSHKRPEWKLKGPSSTASPPITTLPAGVLACGCCGERAAAKGFLILRLFTRQFSAWLGPARTRPWTMVGVRGRRVRFSSPRQCGVCRVPHCGSTALADASRVAWLVACRTVLSLRHAGVRGVRVSEACRAFWRASSLRSARRDAVCRFGARKKKCASRRVGFPRARLSRPLTAGSGTA